MRNSEQVPLKIKVLQYFISRLENLEDRDKVSHIFFNNTEMATALEGEYKDSIMREVRYLKRMGIINYKLLNKDKSDYQLKPLRGCPDRVDIGLERLKKDLTAFVASRKSASLRTRIAIHEAAGTLPETSTESQESARQ